MWEKLDEHKISFSLPSENIVHSWPESRSALDPDPHSSKMLDPDPHTINADPKHWFYNKNILFKGSSYRYRLSRYRYLYLICCKAEGKRLWRLLMWERVRMASYRRDWPTVVFISSSSSYRHSSNSSLNNQTKFVKDREHSRHSYS
jgi:hypothetical protein